MEGKTLSLSLFSRQFPWCLPTLNFYMKGCVIHILLILELPALSPEFGEQQQPGARLSAGVSVQTRLCHILAGQSQTIT